VAALSSGGSTVLPKRDSFAVEYRYRCTVPPYVQYCTYEADEKRVARRNLRPNIARIPKHSLSSLQVWSWMGRGGKDRRSELRGATTAQDPGECSAGPCGRCTPDGPALTGRRPSDRAGWLHAHG
jgi:hypothetical protein